MSSDDASARRRALAAGLGALSLATGAMSCDGDRGAGSASEATSVTGVPQTVLDSFARAPGEPLGVRPFDPGSVRMTLRSRPSGSGSVTAWRGVASNGEYRDILHRPGAGAFLAFNECGTRLRVRPPAPRRSRGAPARTLVPRVVGLSPGAAGRALRRASLLVAPLERLRDEPGRVVAISLPSPGQSVFRGARVRLVLGRAPESTLRVVGPRRALEVCFADRTTPAGVGVIFGAVGPEVSAVRIRAGGRGRHAVTRRGLWMVLVAPRGPAGFTVEALDESRRRLDRVSVTAPIA